MLRIKHERLRRGWNQMTLAFYAGISMGDLSRIETGRLRPYPGQVDKLAIVLDVDRDALLREVSEDDSATNQPATLAPAVANTAA